MEPMTIALIVLVIAGIWAVVELALTIRQARKSVSELADSVNDTIGEVRPAIAKLDGAIDELQPAVKQIEPILEKASTTVDLINVDLVRVEGILSDVNTVTGTGARVDRRRLRCRGARGERCGRRGGKGGRKGHGQAAIQALRPTMTRQASRPPRTRTLLPLRGCR